MPKADLHNHTILSHGTADVRAMYEAGIAAGLDYMGFSEHAPIPRGFACPRYNTDLDSTFSGYVQEVLDLKRQWRKGLPVPLLGLELDWLPSCRGWMRTLAHSYPFDYVYGSMHHIDGASVGKLESWNIEQSEQFTRFEGYYYEMGAMARSGLIQIASHPDFIKLRVFNNFQIWLTLPYAQDAIRYALGQMAENGVAMEVNSAGLRQDFHEIYPAEPIMRIAGELGLSIVLGSDAHRPEDVAQGLAEARNYASAFGFSESLVFRDRKAIRLPF